MSSRDRFLRAVKENSGNIVSVEYQLSRPEHFTAGQWEKLGTATTEVLNVNGSGGVYASVELVAFAVEFTDHRLVGDELVSSAVEIVARFYEYNGSFYDCVKSKSVGTLLEGAVKWCKEYGYEATRVRLQKGIESREQAAANASVNSTFGKRWRASAEAAKIAVAAWEMAYS